MINKLVHVIGERVARVRALMQLGEHIAANAQDGVATAIKVKVDTVFPLDFVTDVIFMAAHVRVIDVELLICVAERQITHIMVKRGAARVPTVLVTERAAGRGIHRRMPCRIRETIRSNRRIAVMLFPRARVIRTRRP
jgi:hypothetical protein